MNSCPTCLECLVSLYKSQDMLCIYPRSNGERKRYNRRILPPALVCQWEGSPRRTCSRCVRQWAHTCYRAGDCLILFTRLRIIAWFSPSHPGRLSPRPWIPLLSFGRKLSSSNFPKVINVDFLNLIYLRNFLLHASWPSLVAREV